MNSTVQNRPISVVLDGTNYVMWHHHITIHLKSLGLYSYVTGTTTAPVKNTDETDVAFAKRSEDWDIKNAKILSIFNASTTTEVHQQFLGYTTAKQVWDLLARRFTTTGLQYQLWSAFQSKRQKPDQSIGQYVSEMQVIRDQLNAAAPQIFDETAEKFRDYFSQLHLVTILMGLTDQFENVRASLLHRHPLPTLDAAISELISEETRIKPRIQITSDTVFHVPFSGNKSKSHDPKFTAKWNTSECSFCKSTTHLLLNCPVRSCKWCNVKHPKHYGSDCPKHPRHSKTQGTSFRANSIAGSIIPEFSGSTPAVTAPNNDMIELMRMNQEMLERIMSGSMGVKESGSSSDETQPKEDLRVLKILSYNVWFAEDIELRIRMRAIGDIIQLHAPDVICLQEVTPDIYAIFQRSNWWKSYKCSLSFNKAVMRAYFCMQLSKLPVKSFTCEQFSYSGMGRELCITELSLQENTPLVVATSHLESPCPGPPKWDQMYSKERVKQANEAVDFLKSNPNVIFCGDMNWDDKLDGAFPLPDGWIDAWTELNPKEVGWTYDTKSNLMLSANRKLQKRLDRFLVCLRDFEVESVKMVGTEPIPEVTYLKQKRGGKELELPVLPSDHFGLLLTMCSR